MPLIFIVHWIVNCHGLFAANVGRIELASAIFNEEFGALLVAIFKWCWYVIRVMKVDMFREKKYQYQNYARKTEECKNNVQSSKI